MEIPYRALIFLIFHLNLLEYHSIELVLVAIEFSAVLLLLVQMVIVCHFFGIGSVSGEPEHIQGVKKKLRKVIRCRILINKFLAIDSALHDRVICLVFWCKYSGSGSRKNIFTGKEIKIIVPDDSGHGPTILIDSSFRKHQTIRTENLNYFRENLSAYKRSRVVEIQVESKP